MTAENISDRPCFGLVSIASIHGVGPHPSGLSTSRRIFIKFQELKMGPKFPLFPIRSFCVFRLYLGFQEFGNSLF